MTDTPENDPADGETSETPIQKALRLKKAAGAPGPKRAGDHRVHRESAGMGAGKSRPWMKR